MSCAAAGSLTRMTSIAAQTHATLDGVIDAPPADALLPYMSDAGRQGALDLALAADALLLPRKTWQGLARAWRDQTGPTAERLNAMPKYVVSATLASADEWDHTTIIGYHDIAGLREHEQLLTYGCGRLARLGFTQWSRAVTNGVRPPNRPGWVTIADWSTSPARVGAAARVAPPMSMGPPSWALSLVISVTASPVTRRVFQSTVLVVEE